MRRLWSFGTDAALVLAGLLYVVAVLVGPLVLSSLGGLSASSDELQTVLVLIALRLPALFLIVACVVVDPSLRNALRAPGATTLAAALISAVVSYVLSMFRVWAWVWQWPGSPGFAFATAVVNDQNVLVGALYLTGWGIITPWIEELVFRRGVLNLMMRVTAHRRAPAVLSSAVLFSAVHFLSAPPVAEYQVYHALWLIAFGGILGWIATAPALGLNTAIAAHAGRNLIEIGTSFIAALRR